ncbi:MAG: hypothetical protein MUF84_12465 [Anaerolineae bacterium]|jgi:hypothetical protein|nr:hypothetical protein [Anaerolineae bacterium]
MFDKLLAKVFTVFAQVMVKIQPIWDKAKVPIALIVGILIGWFVLGWGLFPVEWTNATPAHLREDWRSAYVANAADEFYRTGDMALLQNRLGLDLPRSKNVPWLAQDDLLQQDLQTAVDKSGRYRLDGFVPALMGLQQIAAQDRAALFPGETTTSEGTATETTPLARLLRIAGLLAVALLVLGAAGIVWYLIAARNRGAVVTKRAPQGSATAAMPATVGLATAEGERPVKSFNTPYVLGDDYFDPSFSIEIGADFLGECGIGISETLGAGDPKKVAAFEAWLFDKSDIRTVTKVLASEFAYNDPDLRAKLEPKGEVVMMRPGEEVVLETSILRIKARIRDLEYAQGASLPPNSFVQKVNFELQSWVKQGDEVGTYLED